jgi:dUTP pyrophosphatase
MFLIKKLDKDAKLPTRSTTYAAAYDLYSLNDGVVEPLKNAIIPTGIAIRIPQIEFPLKVYASIRSRSGLSAKKQIEVGAGVIDLDYCDEVKVVLFNHSDVVFAYKKHDRIAQLILEVFIAPDIAEVDEFPQLENNNRSGGFGSTGL